MITLCSHTIVAEELIQKDDLILLFIGASTQCESAAVSSDAPPPPPSSSLSSNAMWRDASFTFLATIVARALSPAVLKYVRTKGCIGHYLKNARRVEVGADERTLLLANLLGAYARSRVKKSHHNTHNTQPMLWLCPTTLQIA